MCIRDRLRPVAFDEGGDGRVGEDDSALELTAHRRDLLQGCLLYTSDAADERSSVDLGGRRIIKKKKKANRGR